MNLVEQQTKTDTNIRKLLENKENIIQNSEVIKEETKEEFEPLLERLQ